MSRGILRDAPERSRPRVGTTLGVDAGEGPAAGQRLVVRSSYVQAIRAAGAEPLGLPPGIDPEAALDACDGLVIPGGGDLPARFEGLKGFAGQAPNAAATDETPARGAEDAGRVASDRALLAAFAEAGRPVLGVCFGMQLINLHFGGSLVPDLDSARPRGLDHGGLGRSTVHTVRIERSSLHLRALDAEPPVHSAHHQAIDELAPGFRVAAWAPDGVVEAIESERILGVEWHPERDGTGEAVYAAFLDMLRTVQRRAG